MKHSIECEVRALVKSALSALRVGGWTVHQGGVWTARHIDLSVRFSAPSRFCSKATWRLVSSDLGVWTGTLRGANFDQVGALSQIYSPEQMAQQVRLQQARLVDVVSTGFFSPS